METVGPLLDPATLLAATVVVASIGVTGALVSALHRRRRRARRRQAAELARSFQRFLDGDLGAETLLRLARRTEPGPYWRALEGYSLALDLEAWRRLSAALARAPQARAERRRLVDESPWRRVLATRRLGLLRSRRSRLALRRALRRGPEVVSLAAARALARYGDRAAMRWLLAHPGALSRRPRPALAGLLRAYGEAALPEIAAALERGIGHDRLELAAVDVVGQGRYRGARDKLERLLSEGDLDRRVAAARALGNLQAVECATSLLSALKDDAWQVRAQAARALGRVGAPIAVTALASRLTDRAWWVRRHAAYALAELGAEGQAALRQAAASSPDPYARDMAREALEGGARRGVA